MQIKLAKIGKTPIDFEVQSDEITFKGYLEYDSGKLVLLKANLNGTALCQCSRCGEDFKLEVDEEVKFFISDGVFDSDTNIDLDVVESFDSMANLDELLNSEIELIKSDYHICDNCKAE